MQFLKQIAIYCTTEDEFEEESTDLSIGNSKTTLFKNLEFLKSKFHAWKTSQQNKVCAIYNRRLKYN